ncbi:ABC transporter substrate-binding protein [Mesorhizobium sp. M7A.F.Ca.CA.001.07.2.1]|uniref:ABC transporter substrate-binding protein n=4 Tax=Phyllobacteriaceae TaxID=69277 RepID=UPI000FCB9BA4|nr:MULTISPECIES: ABC transporter substrate-binding protein [Mesorhizobium]RVB45431.1 ABC transporter substrate-binding protein [Mesorhizobium sp. M7A.F.Ca.CA.004.05.1.1]MCF6121746.1 ABC transporter substrate-binding protein [Mesorhizobium ciceri]MCQ8812327.1 ABC transporter substrate-binding protein [Mesorhizobium sp. SEMIA396]RUX72098.1 ABC transporter substrate-binding protein [Mesorhizobium sp. M7A.F.Ca.CA.004.08.2.1]RUX89926.1 ABC transporter substrate-binding protein [Mesorhizobium sp. M7
MPMKTLAAVGLTIAIALTGTVPTSAQMKSSTFNILMLTDLSSVYSETSGPGDVEFAKMAVEDFGGKVNGVPIKVIVVDNKLDPALSVNKAREIIDSQGVNLITDVSSSAAAIAVAKLANERHILTTFVSPGTMALSNEACGKYTWHYGYDTSAMSVPVKQMTKEGTKKWYFIAADFAFGKSLLDSFSKAVKQNGGEIVGVDMVPFPNDDFSNYLLKAQAAGAQAIGILESGQDLRNAVKQAREFGLMDAGIKIVPGQLNLSDVKALGPDTWAGVNAALIWYWDLDDETRKFAKRFHEKLNFYPGDIHAGNYSAVYQVLKTVQELGTDDPDKVTKVLEGRRFSDMFAKDALMRKSDHLVVKRTFVGQVKPASGVKNDSDFFDITGSVPGDEAYYPETDSTCKHDWE